MRFLKYVLTAAALLALGGSAFGAALTDAQIWQLERMGGVWQDSTKVGGMGLADRIHYLDITGDINGMGNISVTGTITAGKFTDGTLSITGGNITGVTAITLSGTLGVSGNLYATGTITAGYTGSNHAFTGNLTATGTISGASRTGSNVFLHNPVYVYSNLTLTGALTGSGTISGASATGANVFLHNPLYVYSNETVTGNLAVTGSISAGSGAGATAWLNTGLTVVGNVTSTGNLVATNTVTASWLTDGRAHITGGAVTGVTNLTMAGTLTNTGSITVGNAGSTHWLVGNTVLNGTISVGGANANAAHVINGTLQGLTGLSGTGSWSNTGGNILAIGNLTGYGTISGGQLAGSNLQWGASGATATIGGALNISGATVTWPALAYSAGAQRRDIPLYEVLGANGAVVSTVTTQAQQFALLPTTTAGSWGFWNTSGHILQGSAGGATTCSLYAGFVWTVPADFNASGPLVAEVVTRGLANSSALAQSAVLNLLAYELDGQGGTVTGNLVQQTGGLVGMGTLSAQWDTLTCAISVSSGGKTVVAGDTLIFYLYEWSGNVATAATITPQIGRISVRYAGHE